MTRPHERYRHYLETLTPDTLVDLAAFVTEDVHFRDPFNDVRGKEAMERVFRHMFETVKDIRFQVHHLATDGSTCLMAWTFEGRLSGRPWVFDGTSVVSFAADGRASEHVDHWDAGMNLYERLPVIGWLLSRVRQRLAIR
jgi:predicted ester cyclase